MFRRRSSNEKKTRIICSLQENFKLKDLLLYTKMPKATYIYWQKRLDIVDSDKELEEIIIERNNNRNCQRYRRITNEVKNYHNTR